MRTIIFTEARNALSTLIEKVSKEKEPIVIVGSKGRKDAVLMAKEDYDNLLEHLHILKKTEWIKSIKKGVKELDSRIIAAPPFLRRTKLLDISATGRNSCVLAESTPSAIICCGILNGIFIGLIFVWPGLQLAEWLYLLPENLAVQIQDHPFQYRSDSYYWGEK